MTQELIAPIVDLAKAVEGSSTNAIVAGFSFASAVAWMDFVRFVISKVMMDKKNSGEYYFLTALATSVLAALIYVVMKMVKKDVRKPSDVVYAVTA